ncbi:hypothetical protein ARMGADRAFT_593706 [Armillaria gallica]|uniref:Uncharacterized protein n=1 Tax=Armillaria gallica TaxID=47427 RepID=A0A2H3D2E2_ARMGA|nr:hypothetical protein ARMGADRAFT_593706 [Armillaria gallica]
MNRWETVRGSQFWKSYLGSRPLFGFSHRLDSNQLPTTPGISFASHITPDTVSRFLLQFLLMVWSLSKLRLFALGDVECIMLDESLQAASLWYCVDCCGWIRLSQDIISILSDIPLSLNSLSFVRHKDSTSLSGYSSHMHLPRYRNDIVPFPPLNFVNQCLKHHCLVVF